MKYPAGSVPTDHAPTPRRGARNKIADPTHAVDDPQTFHFSIETSPVAYERMTQVSKYTDPAALRYLTYKEVVATVAKQAGAEILDGPLAFEVIVRVRSTRCDASNILKGVEDALNGVCYVDDKQIRDTRCRIFEGYVYDAIYVTVRQQSPADLWGGDHET
jgi:Holliday junction resolvase RusA-like endonuclease